MKKLFLVFMLILSGAAFAKSSGAGKYIALDIFRFYGAGSYIQGDTVGGLVLTCNDAIAFCGDMFLVGAYGYCSRFVKDGVSAIDVFLHTGNYKDGKELIEGFDFSYLKFLISTGFFLITATNIVRLGWGVGRPLYYQSQHPSKSKKSSKSKSISFAPVFAPNEFGLYGKLYL